MSGNKTMMSLASRKQLLVAESEINRMELLNECRVLQADIVHFKNHVLAVGSVAATLAKVAVAFAAVRRVLVGHRKAGEKKRFSWVAALMGAAQAGFSIWGMMHGRKKQ